MPTLHGISVIIRVDGLDLEEFSVTRDHKKRTVECWVPSQPDKEFGVIANSGSCARGPWAAIVTADGEWATTFVFSEDCEEDVGCFQVSPTVQRPFAFSKLKIVDDDALLQASRDSLVGEVKISLYTVRILQINEKPKYKNFFSDNNKMHERAKRGRTEYVSFRKEQRTTEVMQMNDVVYIGHLATFVFHYRPLSYLQAQGIAPATVKQVQAVPVKVQGSWAGRLASDAMVGPSNAVQSTYGTQRMMKDRIVKQEVEGNDGKWQVRRILQRIEALRNEMECLKAAINAFNHSKSRQNKSGIIEIIDLTNE